jgi:hypothetical protein
VLQDAIRPFLQWRSHNPSPAARANLSSSHLLPHKKAGGWRICPANECRIVDIQDGSTMRHSLAGQILHPPAFLWGRRWEDERLALHCKNGRIASWSTEKSAQFCRLHHEITRRPPSPAARMRHSLAGQILHPPAFLWGRRWEDERLALAAGDGGRPILNVTVSDRL